MQPVLQKHNHCFVACVASMLYDAEPTRSSDPTALQTWIVSKFPAQLQKDKGIDREGVPLGDNTDWGGPAMGSVIIELGLAKTVHFLLCKEPHEMWLDLMNGRMRLSKIILCSRTPAQHCVRLDSKLAGGLWVMNPANATMERIDYIDFCNQDMRLLTCDHDAVFPQISPVAPFEASKYLP